MLSIFLLDIRFHDHQLKQMSAVWLVRFNINIYRILQQSNWHEQKGKLYSSTPYSAGVYLVYNNNFPSSIQVN